MAQDFTTENLEASDYPTYLERTSADEFSAPTPEPFTPTLTGTTAMPAQTGSLGSLLGQPQVKPPVSPEKAPYQSAYGLPKGTSVFGDIVAATGINIASAMRNQGMANPADLQAYRHANIQAEMAKTDQEIKLTNNMIALSNEDPDDPFIQKAMRGTMIAAGFTDKGFQDTFVKAKQEQKQKYLALMFKALKGGMTQEDIMAGMSGLNPTQANKLIELAGKNQEKIDIAQGRKEVLAGIAPPKLDLEPAVQPEVATTPPPMAQAPIVAGPGSTALQSDTELAQEAAARGLNPKTTLGILGTEATPDGRPSPKGAAGRFQVMPETARPHLVTIAPAMAKASGPEITKFLANNPIAAKEVAFAEMKKLQNQFGDNPKAMYGAWISGPGNVNPDGSLKEGDRHDGNVTAQQYVSMAERRAEKFASSLVATAPKTAETPVAANDQESASLSRLDRRIAVQNRYVEQLTKAQSDFGLRGDLKSAEAVKSRLTTELAKLSAAEKEKSDIQGRIATRENQRAQQAGATERVELAHKRSKEAQEEQQKRAFKENRETQRVTSDDQHELELGVQEINDNAKLQATIEGKEAPKPLKVPQFRNKEEALTWAEEHNAERRYPITKAGEKVPGELRSNVRIMDNYAKLFELAPLADTGPLKGRFEELKDKYHFQENTNQAIFGAMINKIFNQDLREFAGAGMTLAEIENKRNELFSLRDKPERFAAVAQQTYDMFYRDHQKYVEGLKDNKYYVPLSMQLPVKKAVATVPGSGLGEKATPPAKPGAVQEAAQRVKKAKTPQQEADDFFK